MSLKLRPQKQLVEPTDRLGRLCFALATHSKFEHVVMACIVLNTVTMGMQYYGQSDQYAAFLLDTNYAFAALFTLEAAIKIAAFR
jgi:voltage-dependent calcium channel L type alpha-1D